MCCVCACVGGKWGSLPSVCVWGGGLYHQPSVCVCAVCVGGGIFRHTPPPPTQGAVLSLTRVFLSRLLHEIRHCTCCTLRPGDRGACGRRAGSAQRAPQARLAVLQAQSTARLEPRLEPRPQREAHLAGDGVPRTGAGGGRCPRGA